MGFQQERRFVRLLICLYSLYLEITLVLPQMSDDINIVPRINHLLQVLFLCPFGGNIDPANLQIHKKNWPPQWFQKPQLLQTPSRRSSASVLSRLPHLHLPLWFSEIILYQMQRHPLITFDTLITGTVSARFINFVNSGQQRRSAIVLLINFEILGT